MAAILTLQAPSYAHPYPSAWYLLFLRKGRNVATIFDWPRLGSRKRTCLGGAKNGEIRGSAKRASGKPRPAPCRDFYITTSRKSTDFAAIVCTVADKKGR